LADGEGGGEAAAGAAGGVGGGGGVAVDALVDVAAFEEDAEVGSC